MTTEDRYLLDAVSISRMSERQLLSDFVRKNCYIPEEILYEISGSKYYEQLKKLKIETSSGVLKQIDAIFRDKKFDGSIIDLFSSEGNGDILILATALDQKDCDSRSLGLYCTSWVIVTDDSGLMMVAKHMNIDVIKTDELISRIGDS